MISYMIFRVWIPTSENTLGRALPKSLLAASSSASSKSAMVICCPPRQGLARPRRQMHPDSDWQCAMSCQWVPVSPPPAGPPPSLPSSSSFDTCIFGGRSCVSAPAPPTPALGAGGGGGRLVASPAQEPSLDLAGQVSLELHVAVLIEHLKGCYFLLEVEQAACKKSRLSWAVCMQEDQFQPIIYIVILEGPPTNLISQPAFQLESETGK